jgi:hypothetical protein
MSDEQKGIRCRYCNCAMCPVVKTVQREVSFHGKSRIILRRYRKCRHCELRFVTIETYENEDAIGVPEAEIAAPPPEPKLPPKIPDAFLLPVASPVPPAEQPVDAAKARHAAAKRGKANLAKRVPVGGEKPIQPPITLPEDSPLKPPPRNPFLP